MTHISEFSPQKVQNMLLLQAGWLHSLGLLPDEVDPPFRGFGRFPLVTTSLITLWDVGLTYTYTTTSAKTLYVSSSAVADTQKIAVVGLDENWNQQALLVTLNGRNAVPILNAHGDEAKWWRVFVISSQNPISVTGTVYCYETVALTDGVPNDLTKVRAKMLIGDNISHSALYTVPKGYRAFVVFLTAGIEEKVNVAGSLQAWTRNAKLGNAFQFVASGALTTGEESLEPGVSPQTIDEYIDLEFRVKTTDGAGAAVAARFALHLFKNGTV